MKINSENDFYYSVRNFYQASTYQRAENHDTFYTTMLLVVLYECGRIALTLRENKL
jgi:hypothetical protein